LGPGPPNHACFQRLLSSIGLIGGHTVETRVKIDAAPIRISVAAKTHLAAQHLLE